MEDPSKCGSEWGNRPHDEWGPASREIVVRETCVRTAVAGGCSEGRLVRVTLGLRLEARAPP